MAEQCVVVSSFPTKLRTRRDRDLEAVFASHHNVASRAQLVAAGATDSTFKTRVASGLWVAMHRGVYRPAAVPLTDHGYVLAAVLACGDGALASHWSAAWLWGLADEPCGSVTVFGTHDPRPRGVSVCRSKLPTPPSLRHGIPATNPLRTMLDVAAHSPVDELALALDRGIAARLFTPEAVAAEAARLPARQGLPALRAALDEITAVSVRSPSVLQNVFARVLARAGLPPPVAELPVLSGRYRLDYAYPDVMLAFELDGREHHGDWRATERDHFRRRVLARLGWTVLVYTSYDVWQRGDAVVEEIRGELTSRGVHCGGTAAGGRPPPPRTPRPGRGSREEERAPPSG